jgi:protein-ribulosamine 3-kinase
MGDISLEILSIHFQVACSASPALVENVNARILRWDPSWQSFFTKMLQHSIKIDTQENGTWDALSTVSARVIDSVIPLLLGPLESDGRTVKPSLIHGDLWDGNIGTDCETGDVYVFDAGAYYAHNEMELGMWRCERHRFVNNKIYLREYLRNAGVSEPVEMFDDRNRLYCIYMNMWASAHHAGGIDRTT